MVGRREVIQVDGEQERPLRAQEPRGQARVVRPRHHEHALGREQLVRAGEHGLGIGRVLDDVPQGQEVHRAGRDGHVEDRARVEVEAVALARERAHPGAGLAARAARSRARWPWPGTSLRPRPRRARACPRAARPSRACPGSLRNVRLAEGDLGDEVLVRSPAVALEDQVPAQARPHVVQAARRAAHHLVLQGLVARTSGTRSAGRSDCVGSRRDGIDDRVVVDPHTAQATSSSWAAAGWASATDG